MQEKFFSFIKNENLIDEGDKVLVGVSGGADSVALLLLLFNLRKRLGISDDGIVVVHINHMVRGAEADMDQDFVEKLCVSLNIKCISIKEDIPYLAKKYSITVEEAGRKFRYECFEDILEKEGLDKIAVAHNKNDLAETVLFNMVRGSGLKGIAGIPVRRGNIIRPLLFAERAEIEKYLDEMGQSYRTDSTNLSTDYDRNKLRHIVIPALEAINPKAVSHIARLSDDAKAGYGLIRENALSKINLDLKEENGKRSITLCIDEVLGLGRQEINYLIYEAVSKVAGAKKDISSKNIETVTSLMFQNTGKRVELPYNVFARRSYDKLIIGTGEAVRTGYEIYIEKDGCYSIFDDEILKIETKDVSMLEEMGKNNYTKVFDYDKIKGILCVRTFKEDDYITINKDGGTKKISRLFIDKKIDREKRNSWPLVACGNEIIWAVGLRYNEAYRVDDKTKKVIIMEYERKGESNG